MSPPKAFQSATIECALRAFDRRRRVRRFLVADEVGLGKTVVARGVIGSMMRRLRGRRPLRVFYVCSSLEIATQNKSSLLKVVSEPESRDRSACNVDRLTLAPNERLPDDVPLHLYTLTPDTSIPDRRGGHRSGTAPERALLHNMLALRHPSCTTVHRSEEWLRRNAVASWEYWKQSSRCQPSRPLVDAFFPALRNQLGLGSRQHLSTAIRRKVDKNPLDTINLLRIALAKTGLAELKPDLVIFDEFQRFQDLLAGGDRGSDIAREMVRTGVGGPSVLLLSATPYRLYGGDSDLLFGEAGHHKQFFDLIEWLFGSDDYAHSRRVELECLFRKYGDALRSAAPSGSATVDVKSQIEQRLRVIVARTERFGQQAGQESAERIDLPAPLDALDLQSFRHLAKCFTGHAEGGATGTGAAVAYWASVPLPMQILGPDYKAWESAERLPPRKRALRLTKSNISQFRGPAVWPHPKLRAMRAQFPPEALAIPWLPPSMPWWPLGTKWIGTPSDKALLFSRFRAVPRALAGLMSYDLERHLLRRSNLRYSDVARRSPLGPQRENLAFFHPSFVLARLIDPWQAQTESSRNLTRHAVRTIASALIRQGIEIRDRGERSRTLPSLLVLLERYFGVWESSLGAWRRLAASLARRDGDGGASLRARVDRWDAAVQGRLDAMNRRELETIANAALSSPGAVLARSLMRHGLVPDSGAATCFRVLRVSWEGLRSYFNNPWMAASIGGRADYRKHISRAILDGNLESVLDEHLWVTRTLRHLDSEALVDNLTTALSLRTSDVKLYGLGRESDFHLRSHAVLAFNQAVRHYRPSGIDGKEPAARTEDVRIAFNSPFWPHVLATTSVGQEGLDFHTWCAAVAHWDLPSNPVDLEQREGRVDRYAGLSVRRVLGAISVPARKDVCEGSSPWEILAEYAEMAHRDDPVGLAPWWLVEGARIRRLVFDIPLSEARVRFADLRQQRLLYRLTLGQPDQSDLVRALRNRITPDEVVAATINLSPQQLNSTGR